MAKRLRKRSEIARSVRDNVTELSQKQIRSALVGNNLSTEAQPQTKRKG